MAIVGKTLKFGVAAALLLVGIAAGAQEQAPGGGGGSLGGETRGLMQIRGTVVCTGCSLEEVREAQPSQHDFYQLLHQRGQVVMQVSWVNNSQRWDHLAAPPRLWVRATDRLFQQLSAEENLLKEIEITGLLRNSRTLDIFAVTIHR